MPEVVDIEGQYQALDKMAKDQGITPEQMRRAGWHMHDKADPFGPNPWSAQEEITWNEFEQAPMVDFLSGVYNELVVGLGEGIANVVP
ncbi:MAG: hypothetical protein ACTSQA_07855, partial [Candidatus Heimdallarchaeaceae archaeon]